MTTDHLKNERILEEIERVQARIRLKTGLPHIYKFKWYPWAKEFHDSTNKINLLCAANQISKSSTQIRKCINWATNKPLWPNLWQNIPNQFWYLYPSQKQVNAEYLTKWLQFLPSNEFKDDQIYGWKLETKDKDVVGIHFNSGVHLYFKTYSQAAATLQSGTVDALFCDEELPVEIYEELIFRISASDGYFSMVFTATLGQDLWRRAMEVEDLAEHEEEAFPDAYKKCVSLEDCIYYEDGSPSQWTEEKINIIKSRCSSHNEILKRVFGRFVIEKGKLKYPQFDYKRHMKTHHPIPKEWIIYGGADTGSGDAKRTNQERATGHPAAILFVAVKPDYRQARVFLGWRGDNVTTTAGDVVLKYKELTDSNKINCTEQVYDWASSDFFTIATRLGIHFEKADKSHEVGEETVNTLFKNNMLFIYGTPELEKLAKELTSLRNKGKGQKNDLADTLRYICQKIPWDWSVITGELQDPLEEIPKVLNSREAEIAERRKAFDNTDAFDKESVLAEMEEWNDQYG